MTLEDLFRQLSYGELANLAVAVDGTGAIKKDQQNRIIHFANEGLMRLFSRLPLREVGETLTLTDQADLDHALGSDALAVSSLVVVREGYDGWSLSVGGHPVAKTIYASGGYLHVPKEIAQWTGSPVTLQLTCRRRHPTLNPIETPAPDPQTDPATLVGVAQEIVLQPELHEALTAYIGWKMYAAMNSQDTLGIAAGHRARYEQIITEALAHGLIPSESIETGKLEARGFV